MRIRLEDFWQRVLKYMRNPREVISTKRRRFFITNVGALSFFNVANYLVPLITIPYLTSVLGLVSYGTMQFVLSLMTYLSLIADGGFVQTGARVMADSFKEGDHKVRRNFWAIMHIKGLLFLITFVPTMLIAWATSWLKFSPMFYLYGFTYVMGEVLFVYWFFRAKGNLHVIAFYNLIAKIIQLALTFWLVRTAHDVDLAILFSGLGNLLSGVIMFGLTVKTIGFAWSDLRPDWPLMKKLGKDSIANGLSQIISSIYRNGIVFVVGYVLSPELLGVFSVLYKVIKTVISFCTSISAVAFSILLDVRKEPGKLISYTEKLVALNAVIFFGAAVAMVVFRTLIFDRVFHLHGFSEQYPLYIVVMSAYFVPAAVNSILVSTLLALHEDKRLLLNYTLGVLGFALIIGLTSWWRLPLLAFWSLALTDGIIMVLNVVIFWHYRRATI